MKKKNKKEEVVHRYITVPRKVKKDTEVIHFSENRIYHPVKTEEDAEYIHSINRGLLFRRGIE